jgi:hypothetical protein
VKVVSYVVLGSYLVWGVFCIVVTVVPIGDGGVNAHLWLIITGYPLALISLALPHGSVQAVLCAIVVGSIQWYGVLRLIERYIDKHRQRSDIQ